MTDNNIQEASYRLFSSWLDSVLERKLPEGIIAYHFNIYEGSEDTYDIQLIGSDEFYEDDNDWVCTSYFTTGEDICCINRTEDIRHWEKGLIFISNMVSTYLKKEKNADQLKHASAIGVGFVDGDIEIIYRKLENIIDCLEEQGWGVIRHKEVAVTLPDSLVNRYKKIPTEYSNFIKVFGNLLSPDDKTWFFSIDDYNGNSSLAFCWNELEKISLEAADGDVEWTQEINKFWNRYLPIAMSMKNGYSYYAIDTESLTGTIVYGCGPEFEEVEKIANSFSEFMDLIHINKIKF